MLNLLSRISLTPPKEVVNGGSGEETKEPGDGGNSVANRAAAIEAASPVRASVSSSGSAPTPRSVCASCAKTIPLVERVHVEGNTYHAGCLRCGVLNTRREIPGCNRLLPPAPDNYTLHYGVPYCKACAVNYFHHGLVKAFVVGAGRDADVKYGDKTAVVPATSIMSAMSAVVAAAPAATTATATSSGKNQAPVAAALPGPPATPTVPPPAGVAPPTPTFADDTLDDLNDSARNALLLVDHAAESETESEVDRARHGAVEDLDRLIAALSSLLPFSATSKPSAPEVRAISPCCCAPCFRCE